MACPEYQRFRFELSDGDFIDIDWLKAGRSKLVIICHGLEGSANRNYMLGMARQFFSAGYDIACLNFRGCSGEANRKFYSYHSGFTNDLAEFIEDTTKHKAYAELNLVGFSVGGNVILKYLGEQASHAINKIQAAICFSVPCDLADSAQQLAKTSNWIYMHRFLIKLKNKLLIKHKLFPSEIDLSNFDSIKSFAEFDSRYVAPFHGFASAEDYWSQSSSIGYVSEIKIPTLLVSALNDPFFSKRSLPFQQAKDSQYFSLETPRHGGHVGFIKLGSTYWSETRAQEFISRGE
ncbi:MAG: alpha/beta fold hydrolase [Bdellovibrionota bacterium]